MRPRTQPRWERERPVPRHCELPGCETATRAGKPYCSDHVEHHPYIRALVHQLEERESEEHQVRQVGGRAVDSDGLTAREITQFLRVHGDRSVPRLARDLNMDLDTLQLYVNALLKRRLISERESRRKSQMIGVPEAKPRRRRRSSSVADPAAAAEAADVSKKRAIGGGAA